MNKVWTWIAGIVVVLAIFGLLGFGSSSRQAYRVAKGAISERVQFSQDKIDMAVAIATKSVDLALKQTAALPSQVAAADLIKQDIEEIGNRLKDVAQARGDAAVAKLNATVDQYNQAMNRVDEASKQADSPAVKSALDRIYGILEGAKEQLAETITNLQ